METGLVIAAVVLFIVGIFIGVRIEKIERSKIDKYVSKGYIYVSNSSTQPELFLQCTVPIEDIASDKQVLFDVTILD